MGIPLYVQVIIGGFVLAVILGVIVNKTNFCTMGSVSDLVNIGHTGRLRAWVFAGTVAMLGVLLMEATGLIDLGKTMPPYRTPNFNWLRYILGGTIFGVGMTLSSGCVNKTLVRIGGGNVKSLVVLLFGGIMAYLMTMTNFYYYVFDSWIGPTSIGLGRFGIDSQQVSAIIAGMVGVADTGLFHWSVGGIIVALLLYWVFKSRDFFGHRDNVVGGLSVGLLVLAAWYLTAGPLGRAAIDDVNFMNNPPTGVGIMSFTFVNPMGQTLNYLAHPTDFMLINFAVAILVGVIVGSFFYSVLTRKFRVEWFVSWRDFFRHVLGGLLMGTGGVLAMGCTIGQGITGVSTLALGSALAFVSFVFGSALTMKMEYYKMVYEKEAGFLSIFLTSLVDLHLLPGRARRLEKV